MLHITLPRLLRMYHKKMDNIESLKHNRSALLERISGVDEAIEVEIATLRSIKTAINAKAKKEIAHIEIINLGLDIKKNPVYGGKVTFNGSDVVLYKVIDSASLMLENPNTPSFISLAREWIIQWFVNNNEIEKNIDLDPKQKELVIKQFKALQVELWKSEQIERIELNYEGDY
jgi:hypothetical protein